MGTLRQYANLLKGFFLQQVSCIEQIEKDAKRIQELAQKTLADKDSSALLEYFETDIQKRSAAIEDLERSVNVVMSRIYRLAEQSSGQEKKDLTAFWTRFQEVAERLIIFLKRESELHKFAKEARRPEYWAHNEDIAQWRVSDVITYASDLRELLKKMAQFADKLNELPYEKSDESPPDIYNHFLQAHDSPSDISNTSLYAPPQGFYHYDCYTHKKRFESDLKGVPLPTLQNRWLLRSGRILDAGCSAGFTTAAIAKRYPHAEVIGLELDAEMFRRAKKYFPKIKFVKGDMNQLDKLFPQDYFDIIFMGNNLTLGTYIDTQKPVYERARKVLREQGTLVAYDTPDRTIMLRKEGEKFVCVFSRHMDKERAQIESWYV